MRPDRSPCPVVHARARTSTRGISLVECIVIVGLVALLAAVGFAAFGTKIYSKTRTLADNVRDLTPTTGTSSYCFVAGTLVATPDGAKPIEKIADGDLVLTAPENGGAVAVGRASSPTVTPNARLVEVRVREADEAIVATPGHPFHTHLHGWVAAGRLAPDEEIDSAFDEPLHVAAVRALAARATVYNFEVAGSHTYFVGTRGAWVHNPTDCNGDPIPEMGDTPPPNGDHANAAGSAQSISFTPPSATGSQFGLQPPGSGGAQPASGPLSGHQPPNVDSVDPDAIIGILQNAFANSNYDWNKRVEVTNHLQDYAGKPAFIGYRYYGSLPLDVAQSIVQNGSISGYGRNHNPPLTADQAVEAFQNAYPDPTTNPTSLADGVNSHKNNGMDSSHFVSTSTDPTYVYSGFNNQPNPLYERPGKQKYGLVIVTTQTGEKIYESAKLKPYTSNGQMQGTNDQGQDYEKEHVYGGAILPGSIIYGAYVPMGPSSMPQSAGGRPPNPFGGGGLPKPGGLKKTPPPVPPRPPPNNQPPPPVPPR